MQLLKHFPLSNNVTVAIVAIDSYNYDDNHDNNNDDNNKDNDDDKNDNINKEHIHASSQTGCLAQIL